MSIGIYQIIFILLYNLSMKKTSNSRSSSLMILFIVLMALDLIAMPYLIYKGVFNTTELVGMIALSLFLLAMGIYVIVWTYRNHIKPARADEDTGDTDYEIRASKIHERPRGRDMFEVCDNYRRQYYRTTIIVIALSALILPFMIMLKLNEYGDFNIPVWGAFVISAVIMGIAIAVSSKYDFGFITSKDLKAEISRAGLDPFYVNNDFMMATYHDLKRGLLAIGQSYYVLFMQKSCFVGDMNNIARVEHYTKAYDMNNTKQVLHFIVIIEKDQMTSRFPCRDKIASDLILDEFRRNGIEVGEAEEASQ